MRPLARLFALLLTALTALTWMSARAQPEPPERMGRVALREGPLWRYDGEQQRWIDAARNLPLAAGDRVATERGGYAELRVGSTVLTLDEASELALERLDDEQLRMRLLRGSVALRVRADELSAGIRIGSDDAWLRPLRAGVYRLQRDDGTTEATSWRGQLQLDDAESVVVVDSGRRLQLWREGVELRWRLLASREDAFATRVLAAARQDDAALAASPVSPELTGAEDLQRYGRWETHPEYGSVWLPTAVAADWAPYRDGRWVQVQPWGWTWVDASPWGFAPFHYGRWLQWRARWVWAPGAYVPRPVHRPRPPGFEHRAPPAWPSRPDLRPHDPRPPLPRHDPPPQWREPPARPLPPGPDRLPPRPGVERPPPDDHARERNPGAPPRRTLPERGVAPAPTPAPAHAPVRPPAPVQVAPPATPDAGLA